MRITNAQITNHSVMTVIDEKEDSSEDEDDEYETLIMQEDPEQ
jgi:hypothetical protein